MADKKCFFSADYQGNSNPNTEISLTPARKVYTEHSGNDQCSWECCEKGGLSLTALGTLAGCNLFGKDVGHFLKI